LEADLETAFFIDQFINGAFGRAGVGSAHRTGQSKWQGKSQRKK
jgi:hypothetical protein